MITIRLGKEYVNKAIALILLVLGLVSLSGSAVYASYVAAFIGLGLVFWARARIAHVSRSDIGLELGVRADLADCSDYYIETERCYSCNV